jgi:hypothetical protein
MTPERFQPEFHLSLLDAIDRLHVNFHRELDKLRDSFNLAIDCMRRDIQREMNKDMKS